MAKMGRLMVQKITVPFQVDLKNEPMSDDPKKYYIGHLFFTVVSLVIPILRDWEDFSATKRGTQI